MNIGTKAPLAWLRVLLTACLLLTSSAALAQDVDNPAANPNDEADGDGKDKPAPKGNDAPPPAPTPSPDAAPLPPVKVTTETNCNDRIDNDGDSVADCADADCFSSPACKPTGVREQTDALCSDWIDNDGDGTMDCDDKDCQTATVSVCRGSYAGGITQGLQHQKGYHQFSLPTLKEGIGVDEVIGRFGDNDGERNDYTCSDGIDNDHDGRVDCADFGCQFDPEVTVCNPPIGMRISFVGQVAQTFRIEDTNAAELDQNDFDTAFNLLQLRFLGPIGNLENSFFLVSARLEKTPRVTFALFQLPLGDKGHYFNINSGGGGLTSQLIISGGKQLLLSPAFFVYSAFEQGNGAAMEFGGPIDSKGKVQFRVFGAGGAGRFAGNVGGRFFADDNTNYTWGAGGQFLFNILGYYGRYDSPFLYNPTPLKLAVVAGGKYDQRAQERYPAWNGLASFKWWHFTAQAEYYGKRELEFGSWQHSYMAQLGALIWPKHLLLAAQYGEYIAGDIENPPADLESEIGQEIRRQRDERQFRAALHWYAYEQTGLISARYTYRKVFNGRFAEDGFQEQDISLLGTYRF